jgi:orotidine-5'-phosphate decarboxylase
MAVTDEERDRVIEECATAISRRMAPIIADLKRGDIEPSRKNALALAFNFYNFAMIDVLALKKRRQPLHGLGQP